jgi:hypothetical protein
MIESVALSAASGGEPVRLWVMLVLMAAVTPILAISYKALASGDD